MTIEIHQPELEALIRDRMASGHFASVEDALRQALETAPSPAPIWPADEPHGSLVEICARVRGLTEDVDFSRDRSTGRPLELF